MHHQAVAGVDSCILKLLHISGIDSLRSYCTKRTSFVYTNFKFPAKRSDSPMNREKNLNPAKTKSNASQEQIHQRQKFMKIKQKMRSNSKHRPEIKQKPELSEEQINWKQNPTKTEKKLRERSQRKSILRD